MTRCAECGLPAKATVLAEPLCADCLDRRTGVPGSSNFLLAFRRGRTALGSCPYCGTTIQAIQTSGYVGCPLCYEAFRLEIARHFEINLEAASSR